MIDNKAVVDSFAKRRSQDAAIHAIVKYLLDLQVREGCWLRVQCMSTVQNVTAGRITRPTYIICAAQSTRVLRVCGLFWGSFDVDLVATDVSA